MTDDQRNRSREYRVEWARKWRAANPELARERWKKDRERRKHGEDYKAKARERTKKWTAANRERRREYDKRYAAEHAEEIRARTRQWAKEHPERKREMDRVRAAENPDLVREYKRRYRERHEDKLRIDARERKRKLRRDDPEKAREPLRKWRSAHPEENRADYCNRRVAKIPATGCHTGDDIRALFQAQSGLCAACHKTLITTGKGKYHVDHIVPLKPRKGDPAGTNDPSNLQLLCPTCNHSKHNLSPAKWAERLKRLSS